MTRMKKEDAQYDDMDRSIAIRMSPSSSGCSETVLASTPMLPLPLCTACRTELCDTVLLPCMHISCCQQCAFSLLDDHQPCPLPCCSITIERIVPVRIDSERELALANKRRTDKAASNSTRPTTKKRSGSPQLQPQESERSLRQCQRDESTPQQLTKVEQLKQNFPQTLQFPCKTEDDVPQTTALLPDLNDATKAAAAPADESLPSPPTNTTLSINSDDTVSAATESSPSPNSITSAANALETLASISNQLLASPAIPLIPTITPTALLGITAEQALASATVPTPHLIRCRVTTGVVRFTCSACHRVFEGNSSNAHLHMTTHHNLRFVPVLCEDGQVKFRKQRTQRGAQQDEAAADPHPSALYTPNISSGAQRCSDLALHTASFTGPCYHYTPIQHH